MELLNKITAAADVKTLSDQELTALCEELREKIIETVSECGGHLASNLGVVELSVALHRVFDVPHDQIVWDVGHQCYAHKLLTGRFSVFHGLRKKEGISGFPRPSESDSDAFIVGHSSTSVSAANGLAKAKQLLGDDGYVISVIGDGAMTGGLAYEGLCNAGRSNDRLIVVLNDNKMSINQNVGFVARYLATLRSGKGYLRTKSVIGKALDRLPLIGKPLYAFLDYIKDGLKRSFYRDGSMFEAMGFHYLGPVDGHDLNDLQRVLRAAKSAKRPVVVHVITEKGHGYAPAVTKPELYHGLAGFDKETGNPALSGVTFSKIAGETLSALAQKDPSLCVVTAAMTDGTGLSRLAKEFPKRFFDVGIAEEHAVTFVSGLAAGGCLPVFAVYSTFLQRAYDQLLNDTAIMNNHIVLAIDRAGIVPDDGETHQGIFDVPFLSTIPNVTIYSPSTYEELAIHFKKALYNERGIVAVRYPRGAAFPVPSAYRPDGKPFAYFRGDNARTLIVTYGRLFANALETVAALKDEQPLSVLKLNRIHPLPEEVFRIAASYPRVLFFEEGSEQGGIAQQLAAELMKRQYFGNCEIHAVSGFVSTCSVQEGLHEYGLDTEGMIAAVRGASERG